MRELLYDIRCIGFYTDFQLLLDILDVALDITGVPKPRLISLL